MNFKSLFVLILAVIAMSAHPTFATDPNTPTDSDSPKLDWNQGVKWDGMLGVPRVPAQQTPSPQKDMTKPTPNTESFEPSPIQKLPEEPANIEDNSNSNDSSDDSD